MATRSADVVTICEDFSPATLDLINITMMESTIIMRFTLLTLACNGIKYFTICFIDLPSLQLGDKTVAFS